MRANLAAGQAVGAKARFAVVAPIVRTLQSRAIEYPAGKREIHAMVAQV
jgi:hypothetical protein